MERNLETLLSEPPPLDKKLSLTTITLSVKLHRNMLTKQRNKKKITPPPPPTPLLLKKLLPLVPPLSKLPVTIPKTSNGPPVTPLPLTQSRPQSSKLLSFMPKNQTKTKWTK
jgi:hypothetical protein